MSCHHKINMKSSTMMDVHTCRMNACCLQWSSNRLGNVLVWHTLKRPLQNHMNMLPATQTLPCPKEHRAVATLEWRRDSSLPKV